MPVSFGIIYTSSLYSVISMLPINIQVDAVDTHFGRDKQLSWSWRAGAGRRRRGRGGGEAREERSRWPRCLPSPAAPGASLLPSAKGLSFIYC